MQLVRNTIIALFVLASASFAGGYKVGDVVTDFQLKNIDGSMVSLSANQQAKGFIVVFTCNHCPFAVAYEDRIIALHKKFADAGYPVVAINPNDTTAVPDDSFGKMIERAKSKSFPFPYLIDPTQETARAFGATRTPHVFLVKKENGKLIVKYIGAIDDNAEDAAAVKTRYVEQAITSLTEGKNPTPDYVKAVGCTIKWAKK